MQNRSVGAPTATWRLKHGLIALVICIFCAEAVVAGLDRSCMPSFDLGILAGQLLMMNMFGAPEIMGVVAGIPAFLIAVFPGNVNLGRNRLVRAFTLLGIVVVALVAEMRTGWQGFGIFIALVAAGSLVGFWTRALEEFRRFWFPIGILLALSVGGIIFLYGHYGQDNCWP